MSDDTDDQIHESSLLASAYLDGEATPDERALVETSPDALAEIDALSQVRTVLAATAPVATLSDREAHLAGALDVWERMSDLERSGEATPAAGVDAAAAGAVLTPTSTSEGRRARGARGGTRRSGSIGASQWFLGAAATLVVVAGAAAVVRGILAEDGVNNDLAIEQSTDEGAELSEVEANEAEEVAGGNVGDDFAPNASDLSDDVATDPEADGGLFAEDEAMQESAADEPTAAEQPAPAPEIDPVELQTLEDLADYGSLVIPFLNEGPVPTSDIDFEAPGESCEAQFDIQERLEPARYQGQDVFVGVDLVRDIVYAYTEDCTLVASAPLPPPPAQP